MFKYIKNNVGIEIRIFGIKIKISNFQRMLIKHSKYILKLLDKLLFKDKNKIVFLLYPNQENKCYAFSKYIELNHKNYKCFFITREPNKIFKRETLYFYTFKAIWHIYTAKNIVIANDQFMLEYFGSSRHTLINLWHGMPIKTLGLTDDIPLDAQKRYKYIGENFKTFVTSDIFKHLMCSCFRAKYENIYVTGLPITDKIFENNNNDKCIKFFNFNCYTHVILYLPTFKSNALFFKNQVNHDFNNIFYFDDFSNEKFVKFLEDNNILFIIKPHPLDESLYLDNKSILPNSKNIKLIEQNDFEQNNFDLYEIFKFADLMISDYSSVTLDYLILNKPVIYLDNLTDEYSSNRGMILSDNYEILMPGHKVKSYDELESKINDSFTIDSSKELREKTLPLIHKYKDNKASERIFKIMTNEK